MGLKHVQWDFIGETSWDFMGLDFNGIYPGIYGIILINMLRICKGM